MQIHRVLAALVGLGVAWTAPAPASADTYPRQPGVDIDRYTFHLTLNDDTDVIEGETTVHLRVVRDGVDTLALDLAQPKPDAPDRGMTVSAVTEGGQPATFTHADDRLTIELEPPGRAGERRAVVVRYRGVPITGLLIAPNEYGERTFFSDNWPNKARHWLPTLDHPSDKATTEMIVNAPAHYQVVSNGRLIEETDLDGRRRIRHWRNSTPIATWLNVLGVARFAVEHRPSWRGLPIDTWVYPQDRDSGFEVFAGPTVAVLDFLSDKVGPYTFERMGHVQANSVGGGMEAATSIFYGKASAKKVGAKGWRNVIIHEIAHHWFGNAVTQDDWDHVWLSEGFATYFTHLFIEHAYGRDEFLAGLRADRDSIRKFDRDHPDYRIVHDNLSDMSQVSSFAGTYHKGAWTLHMLRGVIGDAAFWAGIRSYYARYRGGNANTADFRGEMEAASGRPLGWFFDQWLRRGGMLEVEAAWSYDEAAQAVQLDLRQVQASAPYRMPITVAIEVKGESSPRRVTIETRGRRDRLTIPVDKPPQALHLDPDTFVLMDAKLTRAEPAPR